MKPRARAIALPRQGALPWLPWLALPAALLAGIAAAHAQISVKPAPDSSGPQMAAPAVPPSSGPGGRGVAVPPRNVDPGIHLPAAPARGAGPGVIAPPGTPGGNPDVVPK